MDPLGWRKSWLEPPSVVRNSVIVRLLVVVLVLQVGVLQDQPLGPAHPPEGGLELELLLGQLCLPEPPVHVAGDVVHLPDMVSIKSYRALPNPPLVADVSVVLLSVPPGVDEGLHVIRLVLDLVNQLTVTRICV